MKGKKNEVFILKCRKVNKEFKSSTHLFLTMTLASKLSYIVIIYHVVVTCIVYWYNLLNKAKKYN